MAFGKRNKVSNDIGSYTVGLIGESGIGKTTTLSKICEKVFGSDGYILLNVGKEYGVSAIADITYEDVPDYKTWNEITKVYGLMRGCIASSFRKNDRRRAC